MTQRCDECRELFDPETDGPLLLSVRRGVDADEWDDSWIESGSRLDLRFCSQAHAATYLAQRTLPDVPDEADDSPAGLGETLVTVLVLAALLALLLGAGYGFLELVRSVL